MPKSNNRKPTVKVQDLRAKSNPKGGNLAQHCATGKHLDKVVITTHAAGIKTDSTTLTTLSTDALKIK